MGGNTTVFPPQKSISGLQATAAEINRAVGMSNVGFKNALEGATAPYLNTFGHTISILWDSHTVGIGASTAFNSYINLLRTKLASNLGSLNFGIDTSFGYQNLSGFSWYRNENATDCLTGFYVNVVQGTDLPIIESNAYTPVEMTNKYVKILCPLSEVGKTFEIYGWTGSVQNRQTLTVGSNGLTNEYYINGWNQFRISNPNATPLRVETYYIYDSANNYNIINLGASGRALTQCDNTVIDRWFDNAEYAIMALNTNGGNTTVFSQKIDFVISKYATSKFTKLIVLDLDITRPNTSFYKTELERLANSCKGSAYLSVSKMISHTDFTSNDLKAIGFIRSDGVHYTNYGHKFIADILLKTIT